MNDKNKQEDHKKDVKGNNKQKVDSKHNSDSTKKTPETKKKN
ncbi:hypothetical protein [Bizionia saleffrena]|nr:hypothetical protein [Bizionia saleffrena]